MRQFRSARGAGRSIHGFRSVSTAAEALSTHHADEETTTLAVMNHIGGESVMAMVAPSFRSSTRRREL